MAKLVTIYGGSGFVGRYIARRMAKQGWRVRVAVRRPNDAIFVRPYGVVGQVEPVLCNIRDDASVAAVMQGADAVVNCVGTFDKGRKRQEQFRGRAEGRRRTRGAARGRERRRTAGADLGHRGRCGVCKRIRADQGGGRKGGA